MTHPTDEELDALVQRLNQLDRRMSFQSQNIAGARTCRLAADAITAIRTQLAEAKAEKERLGRELNLARYGQPDFSWQVHKEAIAEANARADLAEAALADADAMIEAQAKEHAENNIRFAEIVHRVSQLEGMVMSGQGARALREEAAKTLKKARENLE